MRQNSSLRVKTLVVLIAAFLVNGLSVLTYGGSWIQDTAFEFKNTENSLSDLRVSFERARSPRKKSEASPVLILSKPSAKPLLTPRTYTALSLKPPRLSQESLKRRIAKEVAADTAGVIAGGSLGFAAASAAFYLTVKLIKPNLQAPPLQDFLRGMITPYMAATATFVAVGIPVLLATRHYIKKRLDRK